MEAIGADVRRELERHGPAAGMADVVGAWPECVGPAIARNAWPARLARDGTLHVATGSSAWAFELTQLAPTVLVRLHERLAPGFPSGLRFAVGPLPEPAAAEEQSPERRSVQPSVEQDALGRALAAGIADEELRGLVARAAAASLARAFADGPV